MNRILSRLLLLGIILAVLYWIYHFSFSTPSRKFPQNGDDIKSDLKQEADATKKPFEPKNQNIPKGNSHPVDDPLRLARAIATERVLLERSQEIQKEFLALAETLGLSEEQQISAKAIVEKSFSERSKLSILLKQSKGPAELLERRKEYALSILRFRQEIKELLNKDQLINYGNYNREQRQDEIEIESNRKLKELSDNVFLNSEQKDKLYNIFTSAFAQFDEVELAVQGQVLELKKTEIELQIQKEIAGVLSDSQLNLYNAYKAKSDELSSRLNNNN